MLRLEGVKLRQGAFCLSADLEIATGSRVAVIGPSGGGKSTLLNVIAGFIEPDEGRVLWNGKSLNGMVPGARPVTMIFQDNNLFGHMDAFQNVALGLRASLKLSGAEEARVRDALARVGLAGMEGRKPAALSGGQQSRVALARALVRDRPLLLLDEPFAALGPALRKEMLALVGELTEDTGATLLMVTHDPSDAEQIAEQAVFVEGGKVAAPVATGTLLADPPAALRDYLGK